MSQCDLTPMDMTLPSMTLVLGGAASGKSDYAERLVCAARRPMVYIATAMAHDDEMSDKISRHQVRRGSGWRTVEAPTDVVSALAGVSAEEVVLLDCATMWLSNHMFSDMDIEAAERLLINAISDCPAPVVVVSNEVGAGIVPENALARRFRQAQGELNQRLAARSDLVLTVMAGLPLALKGTLPKGAP